MLLIFIKLVREPDQDLSENSKLLNSFTSQINNNLIASPEQMLEFISFDPFNQHLSQEYEITSLQIHDSLLKKDSDIITDQSFNLKSSEETETKTKIFKQASCQHNMIKNIFSIMKKMVGKHIETVGSIQTKPIVKKTWETFIACKNPTRKLLKAMFDREPQKKLIQKMGFAAILKQYSLQEFLRAMQDLRREIVFRMNTSNLMIHLMDRQIQRKERLTAYTQYLVNYEIKKGNILSRTKDFSKRIIQSIMSTNKKNGDIDSYLNLGHQSQQGY